MSTPHIASPAPAKGAGTNPLLRAQAFIAKNQDVVLVALIVAVIALMIFPLPFPVLDGLIAFNIAISITLLMSAIYVPEALAMSTFPSLLLFTTLLRLGLNIASVKLILLHAHAGEVIETFGRMVVGGNYVVGGVVFLIITIVQFVVIAKGSERVAEVGARFTLDGMPGKQMSIDADLRNNIITADDARRRRKHLELESQMHGGMDGAMKFVKGDAIAGLIISAVNIVAGICVGSMMMGMSVGDAAARYAILTIGDGMVSQIPSLFISIAAGVLITRVAGANSEESNLGADIGGQLLAQPKALLITAIILTICALLPGFPKPQFGLLAFAVGGIGWRLLKKSKVQKESAEHIEMPSFAREGAKENPPMLETEHPMTAVPVLVRPSPQLAALFERDTLNAALEAARAEMHADLGIPFPGMRMIVDDKLEGLSFSMSAFDVPFGTGEWRDDAIAVIVQQAAKQQELREAGIAFVDGEPQPFPGAAWVARSGAASLAAAGVEPATLAAWLAGHVKALLRANAPLYLGMQEVRTIVTRAEKDYPDVASEAAKAMTLQRMTEVFRRLVEEGVPVRNVRAILEALANWAPREKDTVLLTEHVRVALGRYITHRVTNGEDSLDAVFIAPKTEQLIRQSVQQGGGGTYIPVAPERAKHMAQQVAALGAKSVRGAVMVTHMDVRRYVKKMLEPYLPEIAVFSFEELNASVKLNPLGQAEV